MNNYVWYVCNKVLSKVICHDELAASKVWEFVLLIISIIILIHVDQKDRTNFIMNGSI